MENVGIFMAKWSILWLNGIYCDRLVQFTIVFSVLVCCTEKNLAALVKIVVKAQRSVSHKRFFESFFYIASILLFRLFLYILSILLLFTQSLYCCSGYL
jgi:hypothetical protein